MPKAFPVKSKGPSPQARLRLAVGLALCVLTISVFWQVAGHGFVHWDDDTYVIENPMVRQGLTLQGLVWAFTTGTAANWHPLTWISHMLDVQLFGMNSGGHHLSSMALHLLATLLLFWFLCAGTGRLWRSGAVAALFAVHPLHVESVAWVAERKDVLSGAICMLVLLAYIAFVRHPTAARYAAVVVLYALGLMAKPMLVTLPVVMLLLDCWPLGRLPSVRDRRAEAGPFLEKVPLLVLSSISSVVTLFVQVRGDTVSDLGLLPLGQRLANAAIAYLIYLWQTVVPRGLVFLYPFPLQPRSAVLGIGASILVAGLTLGAVRARKSCPVLFVGWLWYLVMLLPVIGLIQIGAQTRADRYTYLPLVGIFLLAAWCFPEMAGGTISRRAGSAMTMIVIVGLGIAARKQVGYWRDDISLFSHALDVDAGNWVAQNNLGNALAAQGHLAEAAPHFTAAVQAYPRYFRGWYNLGLTSFHEGRLDDAEMQFRRALQLTPEDAAAQGNLGAVLLQQGQLREAIDELEKAWRLDPLNPMTINNLGSAWLKRGDLSRAETYYREALTLKPDYASPRTGLEAVRQMRGSHP